MKKNSIVFFLFTITASIVYADIRVNDDISKTWQGWPAITSGEQGTALMWQEDISDSSFLCL
ncbi:MAG: hypothetical protein ACYDEQ_12290, partial [Desulfocucumaceae bacterium]